MGANIPNASFTNFNDWISGSRDSAKKANSHLKVIKRNEFQIIDKNAQFQSSSHGPTKVSGASALEPQIEYKMDNNVLTGLEIKCACGEVFNLNFSYDNFAGNRESKQQESE